MQHRKFGRIGVIANEFFDPDRSRVGGFGMLTRQITRCAPQIDGRALEVDHFWPDPPPALRGRSTTVYDRPLHVRHRLGRLHKLKIGRRRPDVFLTIDWRKSYRYYTEMFPDVPVIMWVQDPRTPEDWARCTGARLPGQTGDEVLAGLSPIDTSGLGAIVAARAGTVGRFILASPSPFLNEKVESTYGLVPDTVYPLCYPMEPAARTGPRADAPTVVFLGRLDPQKRPWLIPPIARALPEVRFRILGAQQVRAGLGWTPTDLPPNVEMLGHVDGEEKRAELQGAWALINTSVHEGLPVSFVEALQHEVPIVSTVDPEAVTSRFGAVVPRGAGDGLEVVDAFVEALKALLDDPDRRDRLGRAGRDWAAAEHSQARFTRELGACLDALAG